MSTPASIPGSSGPLSFSELVDLECLLLADRDSDPSDLLRRDGELGERIGAGRETSDRHELFRRWIRARHGSTAPSPGQRVSAYYRLIGWIAGALALFTGGGTAATLLRYDGSDPVNILGYLVVFVGLQLSLVALTLILMVPRAVLGRLPALGGIPEFLRQLGYRRAGLDVAFERTRGRMGGNDVWIGHLLASHAIYAGVERWMLTALTQRTGMFFNLGALIATVYLVSVRALAFAWSTTLTVDAESMTRWLQIVATPWRWLPDAVPTESLVAASRYFPGTVYDPDLLGDWWPFLVAALVCYGLLPRTALALFSAYKAASERRNLPLNHGEAEALYDRLMRRARGWTGNGSSEPGERRAGAASVVTAELPVQCEACVVLAWAGVSPQAVVDAVEKRFGWPVESVETVSGSGDDDERSVLVRLSKGAAASPVVVGAEAWEPPSKGLIRFLEALRAEIGTSRAIVVALLGQGEGGAVAGPTAEDRNLWRERLGALGDPYLRVDGGTEA